MGTVADSNIGFYGSVTSADTPTVLSRGARYSVEGATHLAVSIGGAGDRAVTIQPGSAWGDGVLSKWTTGAVLNGAAPSGTSTRWDTVVIRRHWQPADTPTGTATLMLLTGGTTAAISGSRQTDAGVTNSDQPIALVRFVGGQTTAQEVIDLRAWQGTGTTVVARSNASAYQAELGSSFFESARSRLYFRQLSDLGAPEWFYANLSDLDNLPWSRLAPFTSVPWGGSVGASAEGWTSADMDSAILTRGSDVELYLRLRRSSGQTDAVDSAGVFTDERLVFTLAAPYAPRKTLTTSGVYRISGGDLVGCTVMIEPNGKVSIRNGLPGRPLVGHASSVCLIATARYTV